ncbi:MAG: HTH domain-containing protein [Nitrososphaeria archaeon]|nr:HTH domain-containing protein [Nitrososphaeria archaeon]
MSKQPSHQDLILAVLQRGQPITTDDIMKQTGLARKSVHRGIYRLRRKGHQIKKMTLFYF